MMMSTGIEIEEKETKEPKIREEEPGELERVTYGRTTLILLNVGGNYQIEKRKQEAGEENGQEVVKLIDYDKLGTSIGGAYNAEIENAFARIRKARGHIDQFEKEKQSLALRVADSDLEVDHLDLGANNKKSSDYLNKSIASDSGKPMVFHIVRKEKFTCDLDYLTLDETV